MFGYYGYGGSDHHFVYHFDLSNADGVNGWEYFFDTPDPAHPDWAFVYDYQSAHFWFTTATLFPYVYDFSARSWLYYFPDSSDATHQHYTSRPRYFDELSTGAIITIPSADVTPAALSFSATGQAAAQQFVVSESGYSGSFTVDASGCGNAAAVAAGSAPGTFTVTPLAAVACNLIVIDAGGQRAGVNVAIAPGAPPSLPAGTLSASWQGTARSPRRGHRSRCCRPTRSDPSRAAPSRSRRWDSRRRLRRRTPADRQRTCVSDIIPAVRRSARGTSPSPNSADRRGW